jgi:multidrug efflux pump subunit AcrB
VLLIGGMLSYSNLGQDEDPPFTFRAMVVRANWPGATALQMAEQVTDKLEKKLQETPDIDEITSYSKPGETTIILKLRESAPPKEVAQPGIRCARRSATSAAPCRPACKGRSSMMSSAIPMVPSSRCPATAYLCRNEGLRRLCAPAVAGRAAGVQGRAVRRAG